jgi:hypothetical protein
MFKSKTVFIVGAGASQEAGLPTGAELKQIIAKKLNITYNVGINLYSPDTGDASIAAALADYARRTTGDINPFLFEAWKIRDAMPQAISIDNFLDAHAGNVGLELCGKLAIVQAILEAESRSKLNVNEDKRESFNPTKLANTWYENFFQLFTENVRVDALENLCTNISFIVFNYDRCVEHFLYHALQNYYAVKERDAATLLHGLKIAHPYGAVGRLPWQEGPGGVAFGGRHRGMNLLEIASQVKTFTERVDDAAALAAIREQVQEAETVVFLGFAFHSLNMQLLSPETASRVRRVFGTAKGISDTDIQIVSSEIVETLKGSAGLHVSNKLSCSALFAEHWRAISRGG